MTVEFHFNTPVNIIKRGRFTLFGLYPEEDTALKHVQAGNVLRKPPDCVTVDQEGYETYINGQLTWLVFNVYERGMFYIRTSDFNRYRKPLNRGMGWQWYISLSRCCPVGQEYPDQKNTSGSGKIQPQLAFNFGATP